MDVWKMAFSIPFDEITKIRDDNAHFGDGDGEMIRDEAETTQVEEYPDAREMNQYDEKELKNITPFCDDSGMRGDMRSAMPGISMQCDTNFYSCVILCTPPTDMVK